MARYGDLDKLAVKWRLASPSQRQNFGELIESHPTADVAPKSELEQAEREIKRLKSILNYYALEYGTVMDRQKVIDEAKRETAAEVIDEFAKIATKHVKDKDLYLVAFKNAIAQAEAELKKKYME